MFEISEAAASIADLIFGNALQNALEAEAQLPPDAKPFLAVRALPTERQLAISISNRFSGKVPKNDQGELISSKDEPGHGLGLSSIRETANRYGGWCGTLAEGDVFTLNVTLSLEP